MDEQIRPQVETITRPAPPVRRRRGRAWLFVVLVVLLVGALIYWHPWSRTAQG